uniref:Uncharacterized protein n=1 Tax=Tanacetum cinerariifolium TaxID=118510 RepID=A0A6L2MMB5_TANCI|nr:hypothetical protein [Tanacetum cinerariifolium]
MVDNDDNQELNPCLALKPKLANNENTSFPMMIYLKNMVGFKMDFFKGKEEVTVQKEGSKRKGENLKQEIAKKQRIDEDVEELKRHLQIVANDDDDIYTEATPLASKLVKERFESTEPKNFLDDFLLSTLNIMFEKPNVKANV